MTISFFFRKIFLVFCVLSVCVRICGFSLLTDGPQFDNNVFRIQLKGGFKPESFFAKNVNFLNNNNPEDQILYSRHTLDLAFSAQFGDAEADHPTAEMLFTFRNRSVWGDFTSIARTTESTIKLDAVVTGAHRHFIPRQFLWMRESWVRFSLNECLDINFPGETTFTLGAFPFELGRGISLGDAYSVGPEVLGFYADSAINQFAFGYKFSGHVFEDLLTYDLYGAILDNKSGSVRNTGAKVFGQEYGRIECPARGFGSINYLVAGRFLWVPLYKDPSKTLIIEPYWLFNSDPEQRIEFAGDAKSKLATFGIAIDYLEDRWEFGFEYAFNTGAQEVRGWDRNTIQLQERNGQFFEENSHVLLGADPLADDAPVNLTLYKAPYAKNLVNGSSAGREVQRLIDGRIEGESQNGMFIGTAPGITQAVGLVPEPVTPGLLDQLYNTEDRFRDPYTNRYKGFMFVWDANYWLHMNLIRIAATAGVASGDTNPNLDTKDRDYTGFIPLQEIYSGKRVRSTLVMSGKPKRLLAAPEAVNNPNRFASPLDGFTNLVFGGIGFEWLPCFGDAKLNFNPNIIAYWQERTVRKFDAQTQRQLDECARKFLGTEINLFWYVNLDDAFNFFLITGLFFPGGHYVDIKGTPLNREQQRRLDRLDRTGFDVDRIPNIGDDAAYSFNAGLTFKF